MWNTKGVPLKVVVLVGALVLLLPQLGSLAFWRWLDDATTPGKEHSGLTRREAVADARARVEGFFDRHERPQQAIAVVRAERTTGDMRFWCRDCDHWLVELRAGDEPFCVAVSEDFTTFSTACSRWRPPADPPPRAVVRAAAAPPPRALGVLVFQRRERPGTTADLFVLDGGRLRQLTSTPGHEFGPALSPDGRRIAFARNLGGSETDVFVMRADGSGTVRLTDSPALDESPTWLTDGRIAFFSVRDGGGSVYVMDPAAPDATPRRLLPGAATAEWSPSGKAVVSSAALEFGFDIWLADARGQRRWNLTSTLHEDAYRPRWSPDGTRIAFATLEAIYVMRADGTGRRRVVTTPHQLAVDWVPNGERIVWVGPRGLNATSLASGKTVRLTTNGEDHAPDWR